ncbi:MAG: hypothetical protein AB1689_17165, partial [Thermodesulfobacteriota bacterium]
MRAHEVMRGGPRRAAVCLLLGALCAPATVVRAAELTSAPHFLALGDRTRVVLFAGAPVGGAIARRSADGGIEVTVPRLEVPDWLAGRVYDDREAGGTGATRVSLAATPDGEARVRIEADVPVRRVHAFPASRPARVMIDLLASDDSPLAADARRPATEARTREAARPAATPAAPAAVAARETAAPTA